MNILIVHNRYRYRGGEEIYVTNLCQLLKDKGHNIYLYEKDSRTISFQFFNLLRLIPRFFYSSKIEKELTQILKQFKPDIVHIHNVFPLIGPTVYYVCKKHKIPIVQTIHNYRLLNNSHQNFLYSLIMEIAQSIMHINKVYTNMINHYIFPSNYAKIRILKKIILPNSKVTIIPNLSILSKTLSKTIQNPIRYFLFVGRLSKEKKILELLTIFKDIPTLNLIVIGTGPLERTVFKYKKYKNIFIKSNLKPIELFSYYKNAIATIIPSDPLFEVCPLVLIESFSVGTPVIVPNAGVFLENIEEKKSGFFFKNNNYSSLKKIILNYSQISSFERSTIKKFLIKKYEKDFSGDTHYKKIMDLYKNLIHEKN